MRKYKLSTKIENMGFDDETSSLLKNSSYVKGDCMFDLLRVDKFCLAVDLMKQGKSLEEANQIIFEIEKKCGIGHRQFVPKIQYVSDKLNKEPLVSPEVLDTLINLNFENFENISSINAKKLANDGIKNVYDLLNVSASKFNSICSDNTTFANHLYEILDLFGFESERNTVLENVKNAIYNGSNPQSLTKKEKEQILQLPIETIAYTPTTYNKFKNFGVKTIGDIHSKIYYRDVFLMTSDCDWRYFVKDLMENVGEPFIMRKNVSDWHNTEYIADGYTAFKNMTQEEMKKFKAQSLEVCKLTPKAIEKFESNGIKTIGDVLKYSPAQIKSFCDRDNYRYTQISYYLMKYGICSLSVKQKLDQKAIVASNKKQINHSLDVKDTPIEQLDITKRMIEKFQENGIFTLGDFEKHSRIELKNMLNRDSFQYKKIVNVIDLYGLELRCVSSDRGRIKRTEQTIENCDYYTLSQEEKEKLLNRNIAELGLPVKYIDKLSEKNINQIRDLLNIDETILTKIILAYGVNIVKSQLRNCCNLSIQPNINKQVTEMKVTPEEYKKYTKQQKQEFLKRDIADLGLRVRFIKALHNANIYTIEDVYKYKKNDIRIKSGVRNESINEFEQLLAKYGIYMKGTFVKFDGDKEVYRPLIKGNTTNHPPRVKKNKNSSDDKYYARQLQHLQKYYDYMIVKSRDQQQFNKDFREDF